MSRRDEDLALLRRLVYWGEEQDPEPGWVGPFERMILNLESEKWPSLTERQRAWVKNVAYLNLEAAEPKMR